MRRPIWSSMSPEYSMCENQHVFYEYGYWQDLIMVLNTKAHTIVDTLVYPFIPHNIGLDPSLYIFI